MNAEDALQQIVDALAPRGDIRIDQEPNRARFTGNGRATTAFIEHGRVLLNLRDNPAGLDVVPSAVTGYEPGVPDFFAKTIVDSLFQPE